MLYGIGRDDQVADADPGIQRPGNPGVDDMADLKAGNHDLGADGRIDLADPAFGDDNGSAVENAFAEIHIGNTDRCFRGCLAAQQFDLFIHGADDADSNLRTILHFHPPCRSCRFY